MEEQSHRKKKRKDSDMETTSLQKIKQPNPVLSRELTELPVLVESYVGVLKDKKSISKAITSLSNCLPCPQYLKRCWGLKIYLAKVKETPEQLKLLMKDNGFDLSILEDELEIVQVPAVTPKTKAQMTYASTFWPMNFHPDLNLEAVIDGSLFDDDQLVSIETCMRLAMSVAENTAVGSRECNGSALIIDPEDGKILAIAASSVDKHPMWHASMIAIDLVAKVQGGGCWKLIDEESSKLRDELPLRYPDSLSRIDVPKDLTFGKKDQKKKKLKKDVDDKCGPYLCTGYWAILLQEPCPLCSMALLHSRVTRIFYGAANHRTGILGSKEILHSVPGLNHRYQVWRGILQEECDKIVASCKVVDG